MVTHKLLESNNIGYHLLSLSLLLFQVNGPAPNDTLWLEMTFAQPIKNINLIRNDTLASGSEINPNKNNSVIIGLPGTQWLKSANNHQLFRVCVQGWAKKWATGCGNTCISQKVIGKQQQE